MGCGCSTTATFKSFAVPASTAAAWAKEAEQEQKRTQQPQGREERKPGNQPRQALEPVEEEEDEDEGRAPSPLFLYAPAQRDSSPSDSAHGGHHKHHHHHHKRKHKHEHKHHTEEALDGEGAGAEGNVAAAVAPQPMPSLPTFGISLKEPEDLPSPVVSDLEDEDEEEAGPAGAAQAGAADGGASNSGGSSESGSDSEAGEGSGSRGAGASGAGGGGGGGGAGARAAKAEEAWDLSKSRLFMQRAHDNGGDCFDSEQAKEAQLEADWGRLGGKERFRRVVAREDKGVARSGQKVDEELAEIRRELGAHRDVLRSIFAFYCLGAAGATSPGTAFSLNMTKWLAFCQDAKVPQTAPSAKSKTGHVFSIGDCQNIFVAVNFNEDKGKDAKSSGEDEMLRYEFLEGLIRAAFGRFISAGVTDDASDAVRMLLEQCVLPNMPQEALVDPNTFRRDRLYCRAMESALEEHLELIAAAHKLFRAEDRTKHFNVEHWVALLRACNLLGEHTGIEARDARLLFAWSQGVVVDEVKSRKRAAALTVWELAEALARFADLLSPPSSKEVGSFLEAVQEAPDGGGAGEAGEEQASAVVSSSRLATFYRCAARAVRQGLRAPPRRPSAGSLLGPPTRPLAPKFKGLMEVMLAEMGVRYGGRGVKEVAANMVNEATKLSLGVELA